MKNDIWNLEFIEMTFFIIEKFEINSSAHCPPLLTGQKMGKWNRQTNNKQTALVGMLLRDGSDEIFFHFVTFVAFCSFCPQPGTWVSKTARSGG